jgi:hypothetical protein
VFSGPLSVWARQTGQSAFHGQSGSNPFAFVETHAGALLPLDDGRHQEPKREETDQAQDNNPGVIPKVTLLKGASPPSFAEHFVCALPRSCGGNSLGKLAWHQKGF